MTSEDITEQVEHFRKELEKLKKEGKLPESYDPIDIAFYCAVHNTGFNPFQRLSDKETFLHSLYMARESDINPEIVKHWTTWYTEYQAIFKKIEKDGLLIKILKEYGFLNP